MANNGAKAPSSALLLGLYNIIDRYNRYLRTSTYVQKIDPS
jgi:hypothetical protein